MIVLLQLLVLPEYPKKCKMKSKYLIIMLAILLTAQVVQGICCEIGKDCIIVETCQDAACGNCTINVYNGSGIIEIPDGNMQLITPFTYIYNASTSLSKYGIHPYAINCTNDKICQGLCQVEIKQDCEEREMNGLAIGLFVMAINAILFILPFKIRFSKSIFLDHILKRCSILLGLFLLSLNTGIMAIIADTSGIPVLQELFRYLWLINWAAYIAMVLLVLTTLWSTLKLWQEIAKNKRSGDLEYGE